ncbi:MAG: hypothetical protein J6P03_06515 [Opitutales bacterium]|nr:hypothetical protein [Opitutales bacterium]
MSLSPEALIASNLDPVSFGSYYATGDYNRSFDQAIFFEIDPNFKSDYLNMDKFESLCVPHKDGSPHKSLYLSVYRVLEHLPLSAFKSLYLTTSDGRTLELKKGEFKPDPDERLFLYQDLAPSRPRVASVLNPKEYSDRLTSSERLVNMKKIAFCDLKLGELEKNPELGRADDLPYKNISHLRDCIREISLKNNKNNKVVLRNMAGELLFRTVKKGFYVGGDGDMLFYPMPSKEELEDKYYTWWRSALTNFGA